MWTWQWVWLSLVVSWGVLRRYDLCRWLGLGYTESVSVYLSVWLRVCLSSLKSDNHASYSKTVHQRALHQHSTSRKPTQHTKATYIKTTPIGNLYQYNTYWRPTSKQHIQETYINKPRKFTSKQYFLKIIEKNNNNNTQLHQHDAWRRPILKQHIQERPTSTNMKRTPAQHIQKTYIKKTQKLYSTKTCAAVIPYQHNTFRKLTSKSSHCLKAHPPEFPAWTSLLFFNPNRNVRGRGISETMKSPGKPCGGHRYRSGWKPLHIAQNRLV